MRFARTCVAVLLSVVPMIPLSAQETTTTTRRDPQAMSILEKAVIAAGGVQALNAIQDFTESGRITYHWAGQDVEGAIIVWGKGTDRLRMDATTSHGARTLKMYGAAGTISTEDHKTAVVPYLQLMMTGSVILPSMRLASVINNANVSVTYIGLAPLTDGEAYQLHVRPPADPALVSPASGSRPGEFDLFIDPTKFQLIAISESMLIGNVGLQAVPHTINFSNYRAFNGVMAPQRVTESINNQEIWTITLNELTFNTGLSDSLFIP